MRNFPLEISVRTGSEVMLARDYFDAVHSYVIGAGKHAEKHGFGLVQIGHERNLIEGVRLEDFIYSTAIGSANIESVERFQQFLEMVKSGREQLDIQYESLVGKAKSLTRSVR